MALYFTVEWPYGSTVDTRILGHIRLQKVVDDRFIQVGVFLLNLAIFIDVVVYIVHVYAALQGLN